MQFENLTPNQIQQVYFELKNQKAMRAYFGDKYESLVAPLLKSGQVLKPTDYVSRWDSATLSHQIFLHDGSKGVAREYGVSVAFIRSLWRKYANPTIPAPLTKELLVDLLTKYGSVRMLCRLEGYKESEVRKAAKAATLELAPYLNFEFGDYEVNRGRRGELYWKGVRGSNIIKDLNEDSSSQSDYDFDDAEFFKVNVKSSKRYKFKAKCRKESPYYWTLSTSALEKCDFAVFALYDSAFENPYGWILVPSREVLALNKKTCTILSKGLGTPDSTGRITTYIME